MSSHHFVTDVQSTALYFAGSNIDPEILNQLLEWNPVIIADVDQMDWLQALNVKVDYLIGSGSTLPYIYKQWPKSELWQRLNGLFENRKANRLAIVGPSEREEQIMWEEWLKHKNYDQVIYSANLKSFPVQKGTIFKKWVQRDYAFIIDKVDDAIVDGDADKTKNQFSMASDGWLVVSALNDVIFGEYQYPTIFSKN